MQTNVELDFARKFDIFIVEIDQDCWSLGNSSQLTRKSAEFAGLSGGLLSRQEKFNVGTVILKIPRIFGEAGVHRCDEAC